MCGIYVSKYNIIYIMCVCVCARARPRCVWSNCCFHWTVNSRVIDSGHFCILSLLKVFGFLFFFFFLIPFLAQVARCDYIDTPTILRTNPTDLYSSRNEKKNRNLRLFRIHIHYTATFNNIPTLQSLRFFLDSKPIKRIISVLLILYMMRTLYILLIAGLIILYFLFPVLFGPSAHIL